MPPSSEPLWLWVAFTAVVVVLLVLDLKVFHRKPHEVTTREAAGWSVFWIALALLFNAGLWLFLPADHDPERKAAEFFTAYLIEKSLSVDNLFVFVVLFSYFRVPGDLQHRVLFLGILGAIVMRFVFIVVGAALLDAFHWTTYVFGGILLVTGGKLFFHRDDDVDPSRNLALRVFKRFVPTIHEYRGTALTVVENGRRYATPLLLVLVVIEATDVVFAVDSIPACFAVTRDPFLVYTSNIFAILGLRALYFLLARFMGSFRYLKYGLAVVLCFVGVKMVLAGLDLKIPIGWSLAVIGGVLSIATVASILHPKPPEELT